MQSGLLMLLGILFFARASDNPNRDLIEKITNYMCSYESIELRIKSLTDLKALRPIEEVGPFASQEVHYIETARGLRYCEYLTSNQAGQITHKKIYWDGSKGARVYYDPDNHNQAKTVSISKHFGMEKMGGNVIRPEPFNFLYINQNKIYKMFDLAKPSGKSQCLGRHCVRHLFPQVRWGGGKLQDLSYDFDEETGIPLQVVSSIDGRQLWRWEALVLDVVDGRRIVKKSSFESTPPIGGVSFKHTSEVTEVIFNKDYPTAMFWPTIGPDASVQNMITGKITPPANQPTLPKKASRSPEIEQNPLPLIAATQPGQGFWAWLGMGALIVGFGFMALALGLKLKGSSGV